MAFTICSRSETNEAADGSLADSPVESTTADCEPLQTPDGPQAAIDLREHEYKPVRGLLWYPGGHINKKDGLTRYGNSHVKDKTS